MAGTVLGQCPLGAKTIILIAIDLFDVTLDLKKYIEWVVPPLIYVSFVLNGIMIEFQCYTFCMKIDLNMVPLCIVSSILSFKLQVSVVDGLLVGLFFKNIWVCFLIPPRDLY